MTTADVFCAVPTRGLVNMNTVARLLQWSRDHQDLTIKLVPGHLSVSNGRNKIVKQFMESGKAVLLMIDDDIAPPARTLEATNIPEPFDIAGVPYLYFHESLHIPAPAVFSRVDGLPKLIKNPFGRTRPAECDAMGTGIMAIRRRVFEHPAMRDPFAAGYDDDGVMQQTEDIRFCLRARDAGFRIVARYDLGQGDHLPGGIGLNTLQDGYTKAFQAAVEADQSDRVHIPKGSLIVA